MMTNVNKSIGLNRSQQGATMIEIMIAILVFSVGLLGLASTQTLGLTNTQSALSRSYAAQLSYELVDIMRLNRTVTSGAGGAVNIFDGLNTTDSATFIYVETANCWSDTGCTASEMAAHQVAVWAERMQTILPDGQAALALNADGIYTLTMTWVDVKSEAEQAAAAGVADVSGDDSGSNVFRYEMRFQL